MGWGRRRILGVVLAVAMAGPAAGADDAFLAGYATAVLEREFGVATEVRVEDGVLEVAAQRLPRPERERLAAILSGVPGVERVVLLETARLPAPPPPPGSPPPVGAPASERIEPEDLVFLPDHELFAPLLADPRWPHFSGAYQRYLGDDELRNVGSANFGETFALLNAAGPWEGRLELGFQAGVFSIFDFDAESFDLVNSDFMAGVSGAWRRGDLAVQLRAFHQSSHLGDEFILRSRVERVNLSYEALDLLLSWDAAPALRLYGGGGYLVRTDPSELGRGTLQLGAELTSPRVLASGWLRPLAAVDLQLREESDWEPDLSLRAGVQLESELLRRQRLLFLLEYYDGRSPNGQFFERDVRYVGIGTHLLF